MNPGPEQQLHDAMGRVGATRFPADSVVSDEVSDLHADLAAYDAHVAGVATSLLEGVDVDAHLLTPDDDLRDRLQAAASDNDAPGRSDAEAYLAYHALLDKILAAARRLAGGSQP